MQAVVLAVAYYAYRLTRGAVDDPQGAAVAFENARTLITIERSTGLFFESAVQDLADAVPGAPAFATFVYVNAQTTFLLAALVYLFVAHRERFSLVRNVLLMAMGLAIVGYVLMPTAPPRFFLEWGFEDTVARVSGVGGDSEAVNALFNPYAAVPSMHVGNAVILGGALAWTSTRRRVRALWLLYPVLMSWVVLATANHWTLDVLLGAMTAALSLGLAVGAAQLRATIGGRPAAERVA